jgi:hypothetical protein
MYTFVAPKRIIDQFKKSKWFKINLGRNISQKDKDNTVFQINPEDVFVKYYYDLYKVIIQTEGSIGSLSFFTDHYINGNIVAVYFKDKEFVFEHDNNKIMRDGVDDYLGSIIKEIQTKYEEELKEAEEIKITKEIDTNKFYSNPGSVTWEDIVAMKKNKINQNETSKNT